MLRLVLEMGRGVAQTLREMQSSSDSRWTQVYSCPRLKSSCFYWTRDPRFSLKRDLRVEVRFAFDDLSLVIFGQPTEPPPKFLKLRS